MSCVGEPPACKSGRVAPRQWCPPPPPRATDKSALGFACVLIRRDLGAFISAVIFKDDILPCSLAYCVTLIVANCCLVERTRLMEGLLPAKGNCFRAEGPIHCGLRKSEVVNQKLIV